MNKNTIISMIIFLAAMLLVGGCNTTTYYKIQKDTTNPIGMYMRARINDPLLSAAVVNFKYWAEIQELEVEKTFAALNNFLWNNYSGADKVLNTRVMDTIKEGGAIGAVLEAHEKWEMLEFMRAGYSLEQILSMNAAIEDSGKAHAIARWKEHLLYQSLYKTQTGDEPPPIKAFALVGPVWDVLRGSKTMGDNITIVFQEVMINATFGEHGKTISSESVTEADLESAMEFFKKAGYSYNYEYYILFRAKEYINQ